MIATGVVRSRSAVRAIQVQVRQGPEGEGTVATLVHLETIHLKQVIEYWILLGNVPYRLTHGSEDGESIVYLIEQYSDESLIGWAARRGGVQRLVSLRVPNSWLGK